MRQDASRGIKESYPKKNCCQRMQGGRECEREWVRQRGESETILEGCGGKEMDRPFQSPSEQSTAHGRRVGGFNARVGVPVVASRCGRCLTSAAPPLWFACVLAILGERGGAPFRGCAAARFFAEFSTSRCHPSIPFLHPISPGVSLASLRFRIRQRHREMPASINA